MSNSVPGKSSVSHRPGRITTKEMKPFGCEGDAENARFRITVYQKGIVRIQVTKSNAFTDASYAVIREPEAPVPEIVESENKITFTTSLISVELDLNDCSVTFLTKNGQIINRDEPGLGTSWIGEQVTTYKHMEEGERFVGLGEKVGPLDRRGHGYEHWNTDSFAYGPDTDPIYSTIPFYIGIHHEMAYGIFFDNSHKSFFNFGASNHRFSSFSADAGEMNYYFIYDSTVAGIIQAYTWLTGRMSLPPLWSIGYQQCRYSYYPDSEVLNIAETFRTKQIPADALVLDIHYMDQYKIFTWDKDRFPHPADLLKKLKKKGFHVVVMCDPGIKVETGYAPYDDGIEEDIFLKYPDGEPYQGEVWPGWCHFPDFTNPRARDWWKKHFPAYVDLGVDGFWNDMNEIATWGQMLPELIEFDFDGNATTTRQARNVYGLCMARSTYEATRELLDRRPFNLTRSSYSGIQRYAAVWTGDNVANDEHMMLGVRLVNAMGLSGIAFAGYDVGGFVGNSSEHLFARWVQTGAFSPFFRGHSMINSRDAEPWAYGEEVEEVSRNYIRFRYKLMMYLYAAFYEATVSGMPVARSLVISDTHDAKIYETAYEQQYMFGPAILVAPHVSYKEISKVYLPGGTWYDLFTDKKFEGQQEIYVDTHLNKLPLFIKESSIIPVCPEIGTNTGELGDLLEWHIYPGIETCEYFHYEDDGETFAHEKGNVYNRKVTYSPENKSIQLETPEGSFHSRFTKYRFILHGFGNENFKLNDQLTESRTENYRFVEPISSFDPMYRDVDESLTIKNVRIVETDQVKKQLILSW